MAAGGAGANAGAIPMSQLTLGQGAKAQSIPSLWSLFNSRVSVTTTTTVNGRSTSTTVSYSSPLGTDPTVIQSLAPAMFDKLTTTSSQTVPARVNINTAPLAVLQTLPGISTAATTGSSTSGAQTSTNDLAQCIIDLRENIQDASDPLYSTPAWLLVEDRSDFTPAP